METWYVPKVFIKPPPERTGRPQNTCHARQPSDRGPYVPPRKQEGLNNSAAIVQVEEQTAVEFCHCDTCRPSIPCG